ncbi:glutamate synthase-related protein [Paraflavisolibacter sp. H34]|uniref:glutamate synthase-related protein n=1 Tax=Huijunlia imazamoxiresistens TaxID=3127457 RepID=UPI003016B100
METNQQQVSVAGWTIAFLLLLNGTILETAYTQNGRWYYALWITLPLLLLALGDVVQKKYARWRHYPLLGHFRWLFQPVRRAAPPPAGCALPPQEQELRVWIGGTRCLKPYHCSIFNVRTPAEGSLSGDGPVWQIDPGFLDGSAPEGSFDPPAFRKAALRPEVKMIELKLPEALPGAWMCMSGYEGLETAASSHPSPPSFPKFDTAEGLLGFVQLLQELSEGKPVGLNVCIRDQGSFVALCQAMAATGFYPDFITIEGTENGPEALPPEFCGQRAMPLYRALAFASQSLSAYRLSGQVKLLASGSILTGFDLLKVLSLGAVACYSKAAIRETPGCTPARALAEATALMAACGFGSLEEICPSRFYHRDQEGVTKTLEQIYFPYRGDAVSNHLFPVLN